MLECFNKNNVEWYLNERNKKYINFININQDYSINYSYFNEWLSGFIEAEGCFSIRNNKSHSFSIGQNDDIYLLNNIKNFFNISNIIFKILSLYVLKL